MMIKSSIGTTPALTFSSSDDSSSFPDDDRDTASQGELDVWTTFGANPFVAEAKKRGAHERSSLSMGNSHDGSGFFLKSRTVWTISVFLGLLAVVCLLPTSSSSSSSSNIDKNQAIMGGTAECIGHGCNSNNETTTTTTTARPIKLAPTMEPSVGGGAIPTMTPSVKITALPTADPTFTATEIPTLQPTTALPTYSPTRVTFNPGELTVEQNGLRLSTGLTSRLLASSGARVQYDTTTATNINGEEISSVRFHTLPDYGAVFTDPHSPGGWIYVNNSEDRNRGQGGVGALRFNAQGQVIGYQYLLTGTTANCGGGKTPWGAYISCEEYDNGRAWQVDPTGQRPPAVITLGSDGGVFESFAYDVRDTERPAFFLTEDSERGALQRFRVDSPNWDDPWNILLGDGITDFLVMYPNDEWTGGTFEWTTDRQRAQQSARDYYPNSEGIDIHDGKLYFISKVFASMYTLDLDTLTYTVESTRQGLFNGGPDQIKRILNDDESSLLFFTEDGGDRAGVHARNELGAYLTILESSEYENETTGLGFSPDGKAMYVAYQVDGLLFEIRREDGLPFYGRSLNVAYHAGKALD